MKILLLGLLVFSSLSVFSNDNDGFIKAERNCDLALNIDQFGQDFITGCDDP